MVRQINHLVTLKSSAVMMRNLTWDFNSIYPDSSFLRDRKLGRTYRFDYGYEKFTDTLLKNLKDNFPSVNFIGIRVLGGRVQIDSLVCITILVEMNIFVFKKTGRNFAVHYRNSG